MASFGSLKSKIFDREDRKRQYQAQIRGLNAYDRHKKFLHDYVAFYGKEKPTSLQFPVKTDQDTLREGYRFIRSEEDDKDSSWEQRLVKRYYDKLFKEYCIADMSHYKRGKIGLRWRTEKEVISGKGQFLCGNKHCEETDGLASYEVNFSYSEAGENKQALVKLVTCNRCAEKLHYKRRKEKEQLERREKHDKRRGQVRTDNDTDEENEESGKRRKSSERSERREHKRKREKSSSDDEKDEEYDREDLERKENEELKRSRDESGSGSDSDKVYESSKEKREEREASDLAGNHDVKKDDFEEFMEGMFP